MEFITTKRGIIVKVSPKVTLPGVFTSEFQAEKAYRKYLNIGEETKRKKAAERKNGESAS